MNILGLHPFFAVSLIFSIIAIVLCLCVTFSRWAIPSHHSSNVVTLQTRADKNANRMTRFHCEHFEDAAVLFGSSASSFLLLARVFVGPCARTHPWLPWRLLECNPVMSENMLSGEQLLLASIVVVVMQVFLKGCSHTALLISWLMQTIVTNACLSAVGADVYHRISVNIPLIFIVFLSYEIERLTIRRFIQEKTAQEATSKLFQLELAIANKKVVEANRDLESKRSMVRHISHEIRTPLNTVCIGIEVLGHELSRHTDQALGSTVELMEGIKTAAGAALLIVNELLAFERLAAGLAVVELAETPVFTFVKDGIKEFFIPSLAKGIQLELMPSDLCPDTTMVSIDPVKMAYVLRNFLSNALKFTPHGGHIMVSIEGNVSRIEKKDCIVISVKDNGAGLSSENVLNLFQEGVQFDANRLQSGGGSGFGLFIAKGLSDLHKGCSVWATSPGLGLGSTFCLEITMSAPPVPGETDSVSSTPISKGSGGSHFPSTSDLTSPNFNGERTQAMGTLNILIVDDSQPSRKILAQLLGLAGHMCTQADDGLAAVTEISLMMMKREEGEQMHTQYDAVLMDSRMPKMNGPEATHEMRGLGFTGAIIAISGHNDRTEFDAAGADIVMMKPVSLAQVTKSLRSALRNRRMSLADVTNIVGNGIVGH